MRSQLFRLLKAPHPGALATLHVWHTEIFLFDKRKMNVNIHAVPAVVGADSGPQVMLNKKIFFLLFNI